MENLKFSHENPETPFTAAPDLTLRKLRKIIKNSNIRHIPVVSEGRAVGLVDKKIIDDVEVLRFDLETRVADVMRKDPLTVSENTYVKVVAQKMASTKEDCALIVNKSGVLTGLFSASDGMQMLSMILRTSPDICAGLQTIENYSVPITVDKN